MDFFGRQDIARKNSKILIFYYAIAVLAISSLIGLTFSLSEVGCWSPKKYLI